MYNWGSGLCSLAKAKQGKAAEKLYKKAFDKYQKAYYHGGRSYNLACLYALTKQKANALKYLDIALSRSEMTVSFVETDEDWKNYYEDQDFNELLDKYR